MNRIFFRFILLFIFFSGCSILKPFTYNELPDYVTKVELDDFYRGTGLIFSTEYRGWVPFNKVYDKKFTPTIDDIRKAENILIIDYERYYDEKGFDFRDYYWKFNRQYFGFINNENEKLIAINFLNFKNKIKVYQYFKNWKEENTYWLYNPMSSRYHLNNRFLINLNKQRIVN